MALSIGTINLLLNASLDSDAYTHVVGIDCGGLGLTGADGTVYLSDRHYTDGNTASATIDIGNTLDDLIYRTERWGPCVYTIPVTAGTYRVRVQLAEIYAAITGAGQRVFTVAFQPGTANEVVVTGVDPYALAGAWATATEIVRDVTVGSSGSLVIQTIAQVQQPSIKGIVVQSNAGGAYTPDTSPSTPTPPATESTVVRSTSFFIPSEFVGIHCYTVPRDVRGYHGWGTATPPTFPYGLRRSLNYDGVFWADIHKGSNPANWDWSGLDELVEHTYSKGAQFLYSFLYTPAHLVSPAVASFPSPAPNWPGSTSMPNNLSEVSAFVTAMVTRYNSGGVRKLHAIEVWNEPAIDGDNFYASMGVKPYWIGSDEDNSAAGKSRRLDDLAMLHKTIALAVRAADSGVHVVGPGWSPGGSAEQTSYWTAYYGRTCRTGGTPLQYTDVLACHPYTGAGKTGANAAAAANIYPSLAAYNACRNAVDSTKPLWGTEAGNEGTSVSYAQHATTIKRKALLAAGVGFESIEWYAYEDEQYLGNPYEQSVPSAALAELTTKLTGRTMTRCSILNDGTVWAAFADGSTYRE